MIVIQIFGDLFRRDDTSGWAKAFWTLFIILVPFLGVLVYLIANSSGMAQRHIERTRQAEAQFADYVQSVATPANGSATELAQAKSLLDSGTISQGEFDRLKTKILA
jgi:hypothetical protein